jgi:hypothetical protein
MTVDKLLKLFFNCPTCKQRMIIENSWIGCPTQLHLTAFTELDNSKEIFNIAITINEEYDYVDYCFPSQTLYLWESEGTECKAKVSCTENEAVKLFKNQKLIMKYLLLAN